MSTFIKIRPANTEDTCATAEEDFSGPVVRPQKSTLQLVREVLDHGGPGYLQFPEGKWRLVSHLE